MFNRQQLTAILNIIHENTCETLECVYLKGDKLMGTDGYHGFIFTLPTSHDNKLIHRDELLRYKATMPGKAIMLDDVWDDFPAYEVDGIKPTEVMSLLEDHLKNGRKLVNHISFKSNYIKNCEAASDQGTLQWDIYGVGKPMIAKNNEDTFFVMPVKTEEDREEQMKY